MKTLKRYGILFVLAALAAFAACSDDSTSPENGEVVTDVFPLALGNHWEFQLRQSVFVPNADTTRPPIFFESFGTQTVNVSRTENIGGSEAYGLSYIHLMDYLFSAGTDTVHEMRYMAPLSNGQVLLKAEESVFNPTGGFIPFGQGGGTSRMGTLLNIGGQEKFISLERLAYLLSDPRGLFWSGQPQPATLLASDGLENNEDAFLYDDDFIYVYDELYKGLRWVSLKAGGVGGVDISSRVTNVLDELDGFEGPIAEVEQLNSFIGALASDNYYQRFYYKSGIGLIRAEISDPEFGILAQYPDSTVFLGYGTWTFTKKIMSNTIK